MKHTNASIVLSFSSPFSEEEFDQFKGHFDAAGIEIGIDGRHAIGPQAGIEWLLTTAVFVYIAKSYFDGMLKELGKDHYQLLKKAVKSLHAKLVGPKAPAVTIVKTAGKSSAARKYSLLFSLLAEASDGLRFKLLIPESASEAEYEFTVNAFVDFLDSFHSGNLSVEVIEELRTIRVVGRTIILAFSKERGRVAPVDPLSM